MPATNQVSSISSSEMGANAITWPTTSWVSSSIWTPSPPHAECKQPEANGNFPEMRKPPSIRWPIEVGELAPQTRELAGSAKISSCPRSANRLAHQVTPPTIIVTQPLEEQPLASSAKVLRIVESGAP